MTIIARDIQKLEAAKLEIVRACKNRDTQKVEYLSLDVSKSYTEVEKSLNDLEKSMGPIYMLLNCAGTAICGKIEDTSIESLKLMLDVNFLGTFFCIKAVVPKMKNRKEGIIVLTASQAACLGENFIKISQLIVLQLSFQNYCLLCFFLSLTYFIFNLIKKSIFICNRNFWLLCLL